MIYSTWEGVGDLPPVRNCHVTQNDRSENLKKNKEIEKDRSVFLSGYISSRFHLTSSPVGCKNGSESCLLSCRRLQCEAPLNDDQPSRLSGSLGFPDPPVWPPSVAFIHLGAGSGLLDLVHHHMPHQLPCLIQRCFHCRSSSRACASRGSRGPRQLLQRSSR